MPQEEHPALIEARERLERLKREQEEQELAAQEQPEETPDIPEPEEEEEHPALAEARAKLEAARAGEEYRPPVEQNEGALGDAWTATKIGGRQFVQGPAIRSETERGLRDITRNQVAGQLADEDIAGIEQLGGKKVSEMSWNEFDRAAYKFYGEEPRHDYSEDEPWLKRKLLGETQSVWGRKLREMTGFVEGDVATGTDPQPSGEPAFPMAKELIQGSQATAGGEFPLSAGFIPNPQGIYDKIVRPIIYDDGVEAKEAADSMAQSLADLRDEYSEAAQKQDELPFIRDEATWNPLTWFGRGESKNLRGIFNATIEQAPMIGGMIVSSRAGGRGGASYASRKFGSPTDTIERMQTIQRRGARAGGAVAGGATESILIRDAVFHETQSRLMHDTPQEQWEANEDYQRLMESGQLNSEEAKQLITYGYANKAGDMAMVISGALMGTPMGYFYGSLTGVSAGRQAAKESIVRQMTKGALTEMGQEMAQESFEQISSNLQVMRIDPNVNWYDGVPNAMVGAAFISGPYGALGGIRSDRGAGVAKERDQMARKMQSWVNAANQKHKFATAHGEGSNFAESASPQDHLKAMVEQERLQEKEATEFLKISSEARSLMEKMGAKPQQLADFDAKTEAYKTDLAFIAKRKKARLNAKKQQREEAQATREREAARKQVERDVNQINDNLRMVNNMQAIQKGESLEDEQQYEELRRAGYGTWTADDKKFVLTDRGVRAMQDMAIETVDIRDRVERAATGKYGGPERRTQRVLRESFENLNDEEFEAQVLKDPQTRLWNKRKLDEDVRENPPNAVAFIDADALKWVNDNMSYSAGDEYLRAITREIEQLGRGFNAYRRGGDEFVVTGPNRDMLEGAIESAMARIADTPRVEEAGKSVKVEASVGYGGDLESAEASLKGEKQRRIDMGERVDTRIEGAVPPSLRTVQAEDSPQMSLFALAANSKWFDDDMFGHPNNPYHESDWDEYIWAQNAAHWRKKKELKQVDPEHFSWIEEVVTEFLPNDNSNNPPITIVHDAEWLRKLSPNQYKELMDLPFGATGVRGLFSLDDPSHGVFLMADVIINEAKSKLKRGMRIDSWSSVKWNIKEGMDIEVIDADGKVQVGRVTAFTKKSLYGGVSKRSASERRLTTEAIHIRQRLNKLIIKETNLLKEHSKMGAEKRRDKNHPITKALTRTLDEVGALESDLRVMQDAMQLERSKAWLESQQGAEDQEDSVTVELKDGTSIKFDPQENAPIKMYGGKKKGRATSQLPEVYLGRMRAPKSSSWRFNLGNEVAAQDEPLTKQMVQEVAADTVMHETVGHYGVRGITKEWDTYLDLTHALVDAFPEVAESLRLMGYNYRDDLKRGEHLNAQNKALLGEDGVDRWPHPRRRWDAGHERHAAERHSALHVVVQRTTPQAGLQSPVPQREGSRDSQGASSDVHGEEQREVHGGAPQAVRVDRHGRQVQGRTRIHRPVRRAHRDKQLGIQINEGR
jgi:diguanylate cyclase (GGDEF)-like protein